MKEGKGYSIASQMLYKILRTIKRINNPEEGFRV